MAMVRKCDRCGKYYDENSKYIWGFGRAQIIGLCFETIYGNHSNKIDLCDECLGKVKEFLDTDILKEREK